MRSDRKEIFRAAADAQRIADYLLAYHPDYANSQSGSEEVIADDSGAANLTATSEPGYSEARFRLGKFGLTGTGNPITSRSVLP